MNLNVKLEGEEEQTLQYVNRFAINIPSNGAAFNLNVVNSGLSNQSYILNPVSPVPQNIVAYQQPMTLQSFIALPTEPDGNIIHSLPVGVSVPIGIPVSTGLLQNHNYVNTGIIIGNEDCNSSGVLKPAPNTVTSEDDLKITYVQKPLEDLTATITNVDTIEPHDIGLNCSSQVNSEIDGKKSCPLEMSIKAANIDIECGPMVTVVLEDRSLEVEGQQLADENMPFRELKDDSLKVPFELASAEKPNGTVLSETCEIKKQKTEITWENNNIKGQENSNDFQESLICEVEEVNDDDDEDDEEELEEVGRGVDGDMETEGDGGEEDEEAVEEEDEEDEADSTSPDESDNRRLSVTLKLRKRTNSRKNENNCHEKKNTRSGGGGNVATNKSSGQNKVVNKRSQRLNKSVDASSCDSEWSESDDDVLNLKRIKDEFDYKCFYETRTTRSTNLSLSKVDDKCKKFVRVRSCCSKLECAKKISAKDQKAAHKMFYDLESDVKRDAYLVNCIEHVQKRKARNSMGEGKLDSETRKSFMTTNIQLEIENESNGNQKLSDEIQNAINESLKDCIASESGSDMNTLNEVDSDGEKNRNNEKTEKNNWNFYIIIDRCRKRVCLQFLIKVFRITKTRIKNIQKNILSGTPLAEDSNFCRSNQKGPGLRDIVKTHLDSLATEECIDCNANPHHRFLSDWCTREYLFDHFKEFYSRKIGKEPNIKYGSYKRLLNNETVLSFLKKKDGICTECEDLKKRQKRKLDKAVKDKSKCKKTQSNTDSSSVKSRKRLPGSNSDEDSSDDEPLSKHRKLKLSTANHGGSNTSKSQRENGGRRNLKNSTEKRVKMTKLGKEKSKQSTSRGRDVWSLMLLHLETMPYKECAKCVNKKKHRFLDPTFTTQGLFEDYRKYFLKETNSELGLGFTMYEKYFLRNCNYTIMEVDVNASKCPRCALDVSKY